jgi:hypothetical protein
MEMAGAMLDNKLLIKTESLKVFKDNVSKIYEDMGIFIIRTADHINEFRKMITPYVNYFYPADTGPSGESFINDVVIPSRLELDGAIDRAANIMAGDEKMNEAVSNAIEEVLGLNKSINRILGLIDEIDIYSENTLIISTKFGEKGMSLARISNEMVTMAQLVNKIGVKFRDYLDRLCGSRDDFNSIRRRMEVVSENYLTKMKLDLSNEFNGMASELDNVSRLVHDMLSGSDDVEFSLKNLINNIQMEDIIRQKIERIMFYLDELGKGNGRDESNEIEDLEAVMLHVASDQIASLEIDMSCQYGAINGFCNRISILLDGLLSRFYGDGVSDVEKEKNRLDMIYNRIEDFKNEYIREMEEIISDKKKILDLCETIMGLLGEFDGLFNGISDNVKRFEALNMITRIELGRHAKLSRTLGGALASVKTLPAQMKQIVKESRDLYHGIQENIAVEVSQYAENFRIQEQVLAGCIASIKTVSVKLYESQKYYGDISKEISLNCWKVLEFIHEKGSMNDLFEAKGAIRDIMTGMDAYHDSEFGGHQLDLEVARQQILNASGQALAGSVLDTLMSDLGTEKSKDHVIIF